MWACRVNAALLLSLLLLASSTAGDDQLSTQHLSASRNLLQAAGVQRVDKIGYVKTHKTGSTTLGGALFRFGARHHKRFYCQGQGPRPCQSAHILRPGQPLSPGQVYDLQLNHLSGNGILRGSLGAVLGWYKRMLGVDAAAVEYHGGAVPLWALVTPLREPVTHYLAWFHYFAEPDTRMSLEQWVGTRRGINGLAAEFGLRDEEEVKRFVALIAWGYDAGAHVFGGAMQLWLPMEHFDDGMLLLRRSLGWQLLDVTYAVLFDSRREGAVRWDNTRILPTPKLKSLAPAMVKRIQALNHLDVIFYDAALAAFQGALQKAKGAPGSAERSAWDKDAALFKRMQLALATSFNTTDQPDCVALKRWYSMSDVVYEGTIGVSGFAALPEVGTAEAMTAAYERSGGLRFC